MDSENITRGCYVQVRYDSGAPLKMRGRFFTVDTVGAGSLPYVAQEAARGLVPLSA